MRTVMRAFVTVGALGLALAATGCEPFALPTKPTSMDAADTSPPDTQEPLVAGDGLCTVTAATPTLGVCKDNGCAAKGGTCQATDTDDDSIWDDCVCQFPPVSACGDGVCQPGEECAADCATPAGDGLCTVTAGTPTLGLCADNGCAKKGGTCKAIDTDNDSIWDDCVCKFPPVSACGDGVCEPGEACAADCTTPPGDGLCTVTAGTPTLGLCADNGCAQKGGTCKAHDTDNDGIWDDCVCMFPPVSACGDGVCQPGEACAVDCGSGDGCDAALQTCPAALSTCQADVEALQAQLASSQAALAQAEKTIAVLQAKLSCVGKAVPAVIEKCSSVGMTW